MSQEHVLALPSGFELNHYIIEHVLGQGGFGVVYKAHHNFLDETVVVKEFLPNGLATRQGHSVVPQGTSMQSVYQDCLQRFLSEGRTLVKLRHHNVVRCRDLFTTNGTAYLVMEFEDGLPLDNLIASLEAQGGHYDETQLLHFLVPLAEGLSYIHNQGVLHRDIKPANVFIRRIDGSPVIIDFGAAKENYAKVSQSKAPYTEFYAPLEQIEGTGESKPTIDIHAFGALMYRLVTGKNGSKAETRAMAIAYGKADPLVSVKLCNKGSYSDDFLTLIDCCLHFNSDARPQSMDNIVFQLRQLQNKSSKRYKLTEVIRPLLDSILDPKGLSMEKFKELRIIARTNAITESELYCFVENHLNLLGLKLYDQLVKPYNTLDVNSELTVPLSLVLKGGELTFSRNRYLACSSCTPYTRDSCAHCQASGYVEENSVIKINIPKGLPEYYKMKLSGQGNIDNEFSAAGDLYLTIHYKNDTIYRYENLDIYLDAPTSVFYGGEVQLQLPNRLVKTIIPKGMTLGKSLRIRGEGIPDFQNQQAGDFYLVHAGDQVEQSGIFVIDDESVIAKNDNFKTFDNEPDEDSHDSVDNSDVTRTKGQEDGLTVMQKLIKMVIHFLYLIMQCITQYLAIPVAMDTFEQTQWAYQDFGILHYRFWLQLILFFVLAFSIAATPFLLYYFFKLKSKFLVIASRLILVPFIVVFIGIAIELNVFDTDNGKFWGGAVIWIALMWYPYIEKQKKKERF